MKGFGCGRQTASIDRKSARFLVELRAKKTTQERIAKAQARPWENLERRLGAPFRKNLLVAFSELAEKNAHPSAIAGWMARVSAAVSKVVTRNSENTYLYMALRTHLAQKHPVVHTRVQSAIASGAGLPEIDELLDMGINPIADVAIAAGVEDFNSVDAQKRLALVWPGRDAIKFLIKTLEYQEL